MPQNQYLNSILNILPAVQARQISELLGKLQQAGTIKNAEEYEAKLTELTSLLNNPNPTPSFTQIKALIWSLCSSDAHNVMMSSAKNDIESSFLQIDELGQRIEEHYQFFISNLFGSLEKSLNEQEDKISELEKISSLNNEFSVAFANSFGTSKKTGYTKGTEFLFFDNRTLEILPEIEIPHATIDENGKRLVLKSSNSKILPVDVKIHSDKYSFNNNYHSQFYSDLTNIIDGKIGTYWSQDIYLDEPKKEVHCVLEFTFGTAKDINYCVIEGASSAPFYAKEVYGISSGGYRTLLASDVLIEGKKKIYFNSINLSSILITFSTKDYKRAEYFSVSEKNTSALFDGSNIYAKLVKNESLSDLIYNTLSSTQLSDICNIPVKASIPIDKYIYNIALDNVYFGLSLYEGSGIYISPKMEVNSVGSIAIESTEILNTEDTKNSVEYELIKIDNYPKYSETKIPIPKYKASDIVDERLVLLKTSKSSIINDIGELRFLPYIPYQEQYSEDFIQVYENGKLLSLNNGDWQFSISKEQDEYYWRSTFNNISFSDYKFNPKKTLIKISNPKFNAIYTCSYRIRTSDDSDNSGVLNKIWLDREDSIYLSKDNIVRFNKNKLDSSLYLQITLRRNNSIESSLVSLDNYTMLVSKYE